MNFRDLQDLAREMRAAGRVMCWLEMADALWGELKATSGEVPPDFPSLPVSLLDGVAVILVPVEELHDPRGWRLVVRRHRSSLGDHLGPEIVVASGTGFEPVPPDFPVKQDRWMGNARQRWGRAGLDNLYGRVPPVNNPRGFLKGITGL